MYEQPTSVAAGDELVLRGTHLEHVSSWKCLGRPCQVVTRSANEIAVRFARETHEGPTELVGNGSCASTSTPLLVLPRRPLVQFVEPLTLSPGGIAWLRADLDPDDELVAARIAGSTLAFASSPQFAWSPYEGPGSGHLFAIRMPSELDVGTFEISLVSRLGQSDPIRLKGLSASPALPISTTRIIFTASSAANDGTYPVSSSPPYLLETPDDLPRAQREAWTYQLAFSDARYLSEGCEANGNIIGKERRCAACTPSNYLCNPELGDVCHPIHGTYALDSSHNEVDLTINRTSSGGISERYVGGWTLAAGSAEPPEAGETYTGALLVLRSVDTGHQFAIRHAVFPSCQY